MSKILFFIGMAVVVVAGGLFLSRSPQPASNSAPTGEVKSAEPVSDPPTTAAPQPGDPRPASARRPQMDPSQYAEKVIVTLTNVSLTDNRLAPGQAEQLRQGFQQLAAQGAAALPAIRQLLQAKQDVSFGKG